MSQHDTLTQALQEIADWNSHTTEFAVDYGSNGVRDFYRCIARAALSDTQPAQAAQGEPTCTEERPCINCFAGTRPCLGPHKAAQGAGEVVIELKRLASACPELNLNNYGPDDVDELNAWAVEVAQAIDQLSDTQPAAGADVPDMVEIMALADSYRNATCQEATASAREWLRAAIAASGRKS